MTSIYTKIAALIVPIFIIGCSFALDYDALDAEIVNDNCTDSDTTPCSSDADCDDGIDCTIDECGSDGVCVYNLDHDVCEYLEMCDINEGCIETGKDCLVDEDCDDEVDCTVDRCLAWECDYEPTDELCQDDDPCIVDSVCDPEDGCSEGVEMECDQDEAGICELMVCMSDSGECEPELIDGADDDEDTFLDETCGGDDCADNNPDIHPAADELCNYLDDDCDGFSDLEILDGPGEVSDSSNISVPQTASNPKRAVVVWQEGDGDSAAVFARVLGTGDCLVDSECVDVEDSQPASVPINLTLLAGDGNVGMTPSVAASDGFVFYVVWVSKTGVENPRVVLASITINIDGTAPEVSDQAVVLSDGTANDVLSPKITWSDGDSGWLAAWGAEFAGAQVAFELIDQASQSAGDSVYRGQSLAGEIADVTVESLAAGSCVVAYSFQDIPSASLEIVEAKLGKTGDEWAYESGWPVVVSETNLSITDPSDQPSIARISDDDWFTAFADLKYNGPSTGLESETDVRGARGSVPGTVVSLFEETTFHQSLPGIVYDGSGYGLLFHQQYGDTHTIDFRLLDDAMALLPTQGGRFAQVDDGQSAIPGNLNMKSDGFETVWTEQFGSGSGVLNYASFKGCVVPTK